ncbi:MAG: twin-arginine translocase TatA/TatE family subunit [Gemmatimonadota bacterium]
MEGLWVLSTPRLEGLVLMFGFGVMEIALIIGLLVLLFGAKRIPLIARGLGEGIRNFRTSIKDPENDADKLEDGSDGPRRLNEGQDN